MDVLKKLFSKKSKIVDRKYLVENYGKQLNDETHIIIENKGISSIDPNAFRNLACLTHLNLAENQLTHLNANLFHSLSSLENLDLSKNHCTVLDPVIFRSLTKLHGYLYIQISSLICTRIYSIRLTIEPNPFILILKSTHPFG